MKKLGIFTALILSIITISACSGKSFEADVDTVYIKDEGNVIEVIVEEFEKDYYDEEELKLTINEEITTYNESFGEESVDIDTFQVKDKLVKALINYKSADDYGAFNGTILFSGTVSEALEAGYEFDSSFLNREGQQISKEDLLKEDANKIIILEETIAVQIDGEILYHSENIEVKADDNANVMDETKDLAYIIYQ